MTKAIRSGDQPRAWSAAIVGLALGCVTACSDGTAATVPTRRDAQVDAQTGDANLLDGSTIDADRQDASDIDATSTDIDAEVLVDAAEETPDGSIFEDASSNEGDGCVITDLCPCDRAPSECETDEQCSAMERCVRKPCGERECVPRGAPCGGDPDCATGSTCTSGICTRATPDCADSRDCPLGYECEANDEGARACVDRRVPCVEPVDCPLGSVCLRHTLLEAAFCVRVGRPCASDAACSDFRSPAEVFGVCLDVDLDGDTECALSSGDCRDSGDCEKSDNTCGVNPVSQSQDCTAFGACRTSADCGTTRPLSCVDLSGQGTFECVPLGGTCTSNQDCEERQMCGTPARDEPPRCVRGAAP